MQNAADKSREKKRNGVRGGLGRWFLLTSEPRVERPQNADLV